MASFIAEQLAAGLIGWMVSKMADSMIDGVGSEQPNEFHLMMTTFQDAIHVSTEDIKKTIAVVVDAKAYGEKVGKIAFWTGQLQKKLGNSKDLQDFAQMLWKQQYEDGGLSSYLEAIHMDLTQNEFTLGTGLLSGLLSTYTQSLNTKLQSDDFEYDVDWYVKSINALVGGAISIQCKGLILQQFMVSAKSAVSKDMDAVASTQERARKMSDFRNEMFRRLNEQVQYAYQCLHPFVRKLKPDFVTRVDYNHWWRLLRNDGKELYSDGTDDTITFEISQYGQGPDHTWRIQPNSKPGGCGIYLQCMRNRAVIRGYLISETTMGGLIESEKQLFRCPRGNAQHLDAEASGHDELRDIRWMEMKMKPLEDSECFRLVKPKSWLGSEKGHELWMSDFKLNDEGIEQIDVPPRLPDHFYTTAADGEFAPGAGYTFEGIAGYVYADKQQQASRPVFRFRGNGDHFYTQDEDEGGKIGLPGVYQADGIRFWLPSESHPKTATLWRSRRNDWNNEHLYSTIDGEGSPTYIKEGSAGYIFTEWVPGTVPLYRWWRG